ncbi:hypothetical protein ATY35_19945 [Vibrio cidicii]|uniref:Uncharacterized protein n=1 Tax=Vibrio cidicii TaxID=1763883 RepID=A0ABR5VX65_9VIBR|nr:hypothetical protein ATY35_19945 [Vibrio cidicii]
MLTQGGNERSQSPKYAIRPLAFAVSTIVPDMTHEAMRDLVRARSCAKKDTKVAKQRIQSILLRTGKHYEKKCGLFATEYGSQINLFLSLPSK